MVRLIGVNDDALLRPTRWIDDPTGKRQRFARLIRGRDTSSARKCVRFAVEDGLATFTGKPDNGFMKSSGCMSSR